MLPKNIENLLLKILENATGQKEEITNMQSISGGDINHALKFESSGETYFTKWNYTVNYPQMFEKEATGLEILRKANKIFIPEVIGHGEEADYSLLILAYVRQAPQQQNFWTDFGQSLADLHQQESKTFGLDHHNYIGSLVQYNDFHDNWIDFFIQQRLEVQLKMAKNKGLADSQTIKGFEKLYNRLQDFFPVEKPSLLHGDLWSGNYMTNSKGAPCIIDPAVYYGHRLMDIGMTRLFGGFSDEFYAAYHQQYPMENNWRKGAEIANLYPLLVHLNLFGAGYLSSIKSITNQF